MSREEISDELLYAWLDGEAGADAARVEAYVDSDPKASARIKEMTQDGEMLRTLIDDALGPVEPLSAMASIRQKIHQREEERGSSRLLSWWNDVWMFNRGAVVGVALATFAGVVAAPAVLWLMAEESAAGIELDSYDSDYRSAGISIESLEVTGDGSARVLNNEGATTLIWLDGEDSQEWDDEEDVDEFEDR